MGSVLKNDRCANGRFLLQGVIFAHCALSLRLKIRWNFLEMAGWCAIKRNAPSCHCGNCRPLNNEAEHSGVHPLQARESVGAAPHEHGKEGVSGKIVATVEKEVCCELKESLWSSCRKRNEVQVEELMSTRAESCK